MREKRTESFHPQVLTNMTILSMNFDLFQLVSHWCLRRFTTWVIVFCLKNFRHLQCHLWFYSSIQLLFNCLSKISFLVYRYFRGFVLTFLMMHESFIISIYVIFWNNLVPRYQERHLCLNSNLISTIQVVHSECRWSEWTGSSIVKFNSPVWL